MSDVLVVSSPFWLSSHALWLGMHHCSQMHNLVTLMIHFGICVGATSFVTDKPTNLNHQLTSIEFMFVCTQKVLQHPSTLGDSRYKEPL